MQHQVRKFTKLKSEKQINITEKVYQQSIQIYDRKQLSLNISSKGDQGERTSSTFS